MCQGQLSIPWVLSPLLRRPKGRRVSAITLVNLDTSALPFFPDILGFWFVSKQEMVRSLIPLCSWQVLLHRVSRESRCLGNQNGNETWLLALVFVCRQCMVDGFDVCLPERVSNKNALFSSWCACLSQIWTYHLFLPFPKVWLFFFFFSTEEDLYFLPASGIAMASTLCTPFSFSHLQPLLASSFHVPIPQLLHWHGFILPTCLHRRKSFSSREELLAYSYSFFLHGFLLCIT